MQDGCLCFPTEINPSSTPLSTATPTPTEHSSIRHRFTNYVSNLDVKIVRGIQNQKSHLSVRRKQLLQQIREVKNQQNTILETIKKRENYFQQHYYKFLRGDIDKFTKYNQFFRREFDNLEGRIAQGNEENRKARIMVKGMKEKLMEIKKLNRELEQNKRKDMGNSLAKIAATVQTTDTSIRILSEPPDTYRFDRSEKVKTNMESCVELPKMTFRFMEPLDRYTKKIVYKQEIKNLGFMLGLFKFRKEDKKHKSWDWFEEIIFKQKNFEKVVSYIEGRMEYLKYSQQ